jgi:hypothetical protein
VVPSFPTKGKLGRPLTLGVNTKVKLGQPPVLTCSATNQGPKMKLADEQSSALSTTGNSPGLLWALAAVSVCIMASVIAIMTWALRWQIRMLDLISQTMLAHPQVPDSSLLLYIAMANFAVLKTCGALFRFCPNFPGERLCSLAQPRPFRIYGGKRPSKDRIEDCLSWSCDDCPRVGLTALVVFYKANLAMSDTSYPPQRHYWAPST